MLAVGVAAATTLLYFVDLFYIQFLLLVWGAGAIGGISLYDGRHRDDSAGATLGETAGGGRLEEELQDIDRKLTKAATGQEKQTLKRRRAYLELELRRLRWSMKELEMETIRRSAGAEPLRAIPVPPSWRQRRRQGKLEIRHLLDSLKEAEEVVALDPPGPGRVRLGLIAADLKASYGALKDMETPSKNQNDYGAAWGVIASISQGIRLESDARRHAPRGVKSRLGELIELAELRGFIPLERPPRETP